MTSWMPRRTGERAPPGTLPGGACSGAARASMHGCTLGTCMAAWWRGCETLHAVGCSPAAPVLMLAVRTSHWQFPAGTATIRRCRTTKTCCVPSGRTRVRRAAGQQGRGAVAAERPAQGLASQAAQQLRASASSSSCRNGWLHAPCPSPADEAALSDVDEEGGRRRRARGGARMQRQGSGRGPGLPRSASGLRARHNVITAFNPVTQVGAGGATGAAWLRSGSRVRLAPKGTACLAACCCRPPQRLPALSALPPPSAHHRTGAGAAAHAGDGQRARRHLPAARAAAAHPGGLGPHRGALRAGTPAGASRHGGCALIPVCCGVWPQGTRLQLWG